MVQGTNEDTDLMAAAWGEIGALAALERRCHGATPIEELDDLLSGIDPRLDPLSGGRGGLDLTFGPTRATTTAGRARTT